MKGKSKINENQYLLLLFKFRMEMLDMSLFGIDKFLISNITKITDVTSY